MVCQRQTHQRGLEVAHVDVGPARQGDARLDGARGHARLAVHHDHQSLVDADHLPAVVAIVVAIYIHRLVQEALTNVAKHARAPAACGSP